MTHNTVLSISDNNFNNVTMKVKVMFLDGKVKHCHHSVFHKTEVMGKILQPDYLYVSSTALRATQHW